jgi:kinesin family protein C2/C3
VHELVPSVLDGFDVCIFAYGATGSGKTFTMTGPIADRGLNPRALQDVLAHAERRRGEDESVELRVCMFEIYNNTLRDLMGEAAEGDTGGDSRKLDLTPAAFDEWTGPAAFAAAPPGMFSARVHSVDDIMTVMATGNALRARASTELNTLSSRSHTILIVHATTTNLLTGSSTVGRMHLIDLAGSEDAGRSGARRQGGALAEEARHINSSLEALGKVMRAHARKTPPDEIDYGESALTQMLRGSLQAQTKMVMLVHVNPNPTLAAEARQTLEFGAGVRSIELGEARARAVGAADTAHRALASAVAGASLQ